MLIALDLPPWLIYGLLFCFGSIVGSFLNVCIIRIPPHERAREAIAALWRSPSHCPKCKTSIRWHDNVPILGWLLLRGRCRTCRLSISPRYPLIELLTGLLFVLVFWFEFPGPNWGPLEHSSVYSPLGPQAFPGLGGLNPTVFVLLRIMFHLVLVSALIVATFIDFDLRIIPDGVTFPGMAAGLLGGLVIGRVHLVPVYFQRDAWMDPTFVPAEVPAWVSAHPHLHGLAVSLAGLIVGGGVVWGVRIVGRWALKQEAMGFGDVILMAMIGSFLGWQPTLLVFFLAPLCALLVVAASVLFRRERVIPFGPYLSLAALVTLLAWPLLWPAVERIFGMGPLLIPLAAFASGLLAVALFAARMIRRALGIADFVEPMGEWTAADQNFFFAGEHVDRHAGRWPCRHDWPGAASSRGALHYEQWRRP